MGPDDSSGRPPGYPRRGKRPACGEFVRRENLFPEFVPSGFSIARAWLSSSLATARARRRPGKMRWTMAASSENMLPKILVVDDSHDERMLIANQLAEGSYTIETASSGEEALRRLSQGGVDLLVTDFVMPGVDGLQLMNRALEMDPKLEGRVLIV